MEIGFAGAGRAGCSLGKYFAGKGQIITGFYDVSGQEAESAAAFAGGKKFDQLEDLAAASQVIFLTTPDGKILQVWEELRRLPLAGKLICHCSGALSSSLFLGAPETGAKCLSIHPMLPFSSRFSSYDQLKEAFFTAEGDAEGVRIMTDLLTSFGNQVCQIDGGQKVRYHAAASIVSNQVIGVLDTGFRLLEECGFSRQEAVAASAALIRNNIENVLAQDCTGALTGPIDRNDLGTVGKHLSCLNEEDREMYRVLGKKLVKIAQAKNPDVDYGEMLACLNGEDFCRQQQG